MVFNFESKSADVTTAISERSQNVTNINNEEFDLVKLNLAKFDSEEPKNKKVESRSRIRNWLIQAGYFGSAMLRKRS